MRLLSLTLVIVALGVGGVALAQPQLVIDPWGAANADVDSWFGQASNERSEKSMADPVLVDPWQPAPEPERAPAPRTKRVEVFPVAPAANAPAKSTSPLPATAPIVIDPWARVVAPQIPSLESEPRPLVAERSSPWSGRMIEIVDPWGRLPDFVASDRVRLIVDPWAR